MIVAFGVALPFGIGSALSAIKTVVKRVEESNAKKNHAEWVCVSLPWRNPLGFP